MSYSSSDLGKVLFLYKTEWKLLFRLRFAEAKYREIQKYVKLNERQIEIYRLAGASDKLCHGLILPY
jgi:hypothetical protein